MILHRTVAGLISSRERKSLGDDLSALSSICAKVDIRGDFANLHRVHCAGSSLWTTPGGVKCIQEACDKYDFEQALKIQRDLESKLKSQEHDIKELREKVEIKAWHEQLNLNVPQTDSTKVQSEHAVIPSSNGTVPISGPPQKNVKGDEGSVTSTGVERTNISKSDALDLESVATSISKSTCHGQRSVD